MFGGSDVRIEEHHIQGIGYGFMPKTVEMRRLKRVYIIGSKETVDMARSLCRKHGLMVGTSSGANMLVARSVSKKSG
jgi:cysteine synthase A